MLGIDGGRSVWQRLLNKRRSVILTWLLSYLGILLVPILISLFVYNQSQQILRSEIHRANSVLLKEAREMIDNHVQHAERLTTELMWNVRLRGFIYSSLYQQPGSLDDSLYELHQTAKEIAIYQSLYPAVQTYYIYWKDQDIVFEPGVYRDSRLAHSTLHENDTLSYEMWLDILRGNKTGHFIKLESKTSPSGSIAYIHSFPGGSMDSSPGSVVVLLNTSKLMETLRNVQTFSSGQVLVLNRNHQILLSTSANRDPLFLAGMDFEGQSGMSLVDIEGERSEVMYIKSDNSELTYATVVPSSLLWQKTNYLKFVTYIGLLVSLIGGIGLTIIFLLRNYSPVQRLLRVLSPETQAAAAPEGNEFLHIQNAIVSTLNEKGQIQLRMRQQSNMLRSNMLARMLKGRFASQIAIDESLTAFDVRFHSDRFAVLLFYVDYERFNEHLEGIPVADKPWLMQFIVTNIVEELAGERHRGFVCEIDNHMACLINYAPDGDDGPLQEETEALASRARQFLSEKFNIHMLVAISGIKHSPVEIPQAYRETVDAMEYMVVIGDREQVAYEEIRREEPEGLEAGYYYPIQVEQQLINYVKAGDAAKAEAIIRDIVAKNTGSSPVSIVLVKCLMFNLISTLIKTIGEIGDVEESGFVSNSFRITELINCESIKEMETRLSVVVQEVCDYVLLKQKQQSNQTRNQALRERSDEIAAFIAANYKDENLNISMIGERFGMTPTYISRLFKEQTGQGLLDTINQVRLTHAKDLLRNSGDSIKTIAAQVGFHDINTFIRIFKKYEGVTPGQYQKIL